MNKKQTLKQINDLHNQAFNLAIKLVELEARKILSKHKSLNEFIMCMGSAFFTDKQGNPINSWDYKYTLTFINFVDDLNNTFKIMGYPMRFTAEGEIENNW